MKSLLQDVRDTIAFYKSKAAPAQGSDLPEGTYVYKTLSFILYIPDPDFFQPPVDLERKHHFNDIAQRYRMPEGIPARDLQAYAVFLFHECRDNTDCASSAGKKICHLYDRLLDLNPVLRSVPVQPGSLEQRYHVAMGAISAFNVGDIRHFVEGKTGLVSRADPAWRHLSETLERNGIEPQWIPSMQTLNELTRQTAARKQANGTESPPRPSAPKP